MRLRILHWHMIYGIPHDVLKAAYRNADDYNISPDNIITQANNLDVKLPNCFMNGNFLPHRHIEQRGHWFSERMARNFFKDRLATHLYQIIRDNEDTFDDGQRAIASCLGNATVPADYMYDCTIDNVTNESDLICTYNQRNGMITKEIGVGKMLRKIPLPFEFRDHQIEFIVNKIKSRYVLNVTIREVSGESIRDWYHYSKYAEGTGSLAQSCMRHSSCQDYMDIYVENNVRMIIATDQNNLLLGRAIVWPKDVWNKNYFENHVALVDRIYGNDMIIQKIKDYCYEKNYVHKYYQSYDNRREWQYMNNGELVIEDKRCRVNIHTDFDYFPYMDTFAIKDDGYLKNHGSGEMLTCTDGYTRSTNYCEGCEREIDEDNTYYIDGHGEYCDECTRYVDRDDCNYLRDDTIWIENISEYVHQDDAIYDDYNSEYILDDDSVELYDGTNTHRSDCIYQGDSSVHAEMNNLYYVNVTNNNESVDVYLTEDMSERHIHHAFEHYDIIIGNSYDIVIHHNDNTYVFTNKIINNDTIKEFLENVTQQA